MINYRNIVKAIGNIGRDAVVSVSEKDNKKQVNFLLGVTETIGNIDTFWWEVYIDFPIDSEVKILQYLKKGKLISIEGSPIIKAWAKKNPKGNAVMHENQPIIIHRNYLLAEKKSIVLLN